MPYCGPAPVPDQLWHSWNLDPAVLIALALLALWLMRSDQRGAGMLAVAALAVAFVSPLCALTVALFSARTVHHLLLIAVAAPALAVAWPAMVRVPAGLSLAALTGAMIAWHLPDLYAAIWASDGLYWLMQAAMLLPAWAFWSAVLAPRPSAPEALRRAGLIGGLAGVMGLLGAALTFAPAILYVPHLGTTLPWGLPPLADQQLAGLIMWVPGFVPMAAIAALVLGRAWRAEVAR